jgi:alanyl-tRNA synthetase
VGGSGGGGSKAMAQAGGPEGGKWEEAVKAVRDKLK